MKTNHRFAAIALSVALGTSFACDGSRTPTAPGSAQAWTLAIEGPSTVPPGEDAQFRAIMQSPDGSRRDVSGEAAWTTSNAAVLAVSRGGAAKGLARGEAAIAASFAGRYAVKEAMVIPAGTFRLTGIARDAGRPVGGAQVTVTSEATALSAVTDALTGAYRIYGVRGDVQIRATKYGYLPSVQTAFVDSHRTLDVSLAPADPIPTVAGSYRLTVTAAAACVALPAHVRARTYAADVKQDGALLTVTLGGADFYAEGAITANKFAGSVQPGRLVFRMQPPLDNSYVSEIFEIITAVPPAAVALMGDIVAEKTPDGYAGVLSGSFKLWSGTASPVSCTSDEHGFVLQHGPGSAS